MEERAIARKNGFKRPWHPYQVSSWIGVLLTIILSELITVPMAQISSQISYLVLFHLALICLVYSGFKTTFINPTDPLSLTHLPHNSLPNHPFCTICNSQVSLQSKHCCSCNRCVEDFDHHCPWINNCISKKNFSFYIMLIYSLLLYSVLIVAYGTCLLVLYVSNQKMVQNQVLHYENPTAWLVLLVFLIFMSFLVMILAGRLVILHIWLRRKKLSMFEYYLISKKAKLAKVTPNNTSIGYENDLSIGEIKPEVSMNIKKLI